MTLRGRLACSCCCDDPRLYRFLFPFQLSVHVFKLDRHGAQAEELEVEEGEGTGVTAATHWVLPSLELEVGLMVRRGRKKGHLHLFSHLSPGSMGVPHLRRGSEEVAAQLRHDHARGV